MRERARVSIHIAKCYQHYMKSQVVVGVLTCTVISTVYFYVITLFHNVVYS